MTTYGDTYNWDKTWLNAAPLERTNGRQSAEPIFQHKRHFDQSDSYDLWGPEYQTGEIAQDPFFIIRSGKCKELAYPNILYRRAKSAPRESHGQSLQVRNKKLPQRPKSDEIAEVKKPTKSKSKNHSKDRSLPKDQKKPIERWPELKLDIPSDSPNPRPTKCPEYQRSFSPSLEDAYKRVRPQSSRSQMEKPKPKGSFSSLESKKAKFKSEDRLSRCSEFETLSKHSTSALGISKPEVHRRKLQSEYQANYRDLSDFKNVAKIHNNIARQNQLQVEGCHFSHKHFNQLDSANVNLWDPSFSARAEVVGITPTEMTKRLREFKVPTPQRRFDVALSDTGPRNPQQMPKLPFRYPFSALSARYEPRKYLDKPSRDEEERIVVLPYEDINNFECTHSRHYCNRGGNLLISRNRPDEINATSIPSTLHYDYLPPGSPMSPTSSLSLAEHTLDRALKRRNKLLISTSRN